MATNQRRKERYHSDPEYRRKRIEDALARKKPKPVDRLRGWEPIHSAPETETVFLYDPEIFWPVLATWDSDRHDWEGVHYEGKIRPTHWRYPPKVPLT